MDTHRHGFRRVALDGALLLFDPTRGLNVRIDAPGTRALRRTAPRTVMFAITNACNLACTFCNRDLAAPSTWTVDSAHALLTALAQRGVLEVAFGGGEPFTFRGFDELLERLAGDTALALNVTTNGALLTAERAQRLAPFLGEVRVSLYDGHDQETPLRTLADAGIARGANVLVDPATLDALPTKLDALARLGCHDVALLRYVGPDAARELSADDATFLTHVIAHSPLPVRLSTCFGEQLPDVPRLFPQGDCGAGDEFVVVTSDGRTKACSFQAQSVAFDGADGLLAFWRARRERSRAPFAGCARPFTSEAPAFEGVRVWQGWSSNNSGDCVLVGRFETPEASRAFVERLRALQPATGAPYSDALRAQLTAIGVTPGEDEEAPEELVAVGSAALLHTDMALDDAFPSLRALLWHEGGRAVFNGIHVHESLSLVSALRFTDDAAAKRAHAQLAIPHVRAERHGALVYAVHGWDGLPALESPVLAASSELTHTPDQDELARALRAPPPPPGPAWLFARFRDADAARAAAFPAADVAGRYLVVPWTRRAPRDGFRLQRAGGLTIAVDGPLFDFQVSMWSQRRDGLGSVSNELKAVLGPELCQALTLSRHGSATLTTAQPGKVLHVLVPFAEARGFNLWLSAASGSSMAHVVARLRADVMR